MIDADAKTTTLRMIPYGPYVVTADDGKGTVDAATVNWVTRTAFSPLMVVVRRRALGDNVFHRAADNEVLT